MICIECNKLEATHRNKQLCDDCYKELRKQQSKKFNDGNKEKIKLKNLLYREANKEKISQINKDWYLKPGNKERKNKQSTENYAKRTGYKNE